VILKFKGVITPTLGVIGSPACVNGEIYTLGRLDPGMTQQSRVKMEKQHTTETERLWDTIIVLNK
jgi:hypothetical protein